MKLKSVITDLGLVYAAAIWGSTFYLVKDSLAFIHPILLVGHRFTLASVVLAVFLALKHKSLFTNFKPGFILGVILWLLYAPQTVGLKYTSAANSGLITGLFVAFVPVFSYLLTRTLPTKSKVIAILISLSGLWILTGGLKQTNLGDLFTLVTAAAYGAYIIVTDKFVKAKFDPWVLSFQQFFTVGLLSYIWAILFKIPFSSLSSSTLGTIIFLALFPTLSAFVIQLVAQKTVHPLKIALIFTLEPVFAAIFAWTLGGEVFTLHQALGGLLIVTAMIISELKN